MKPPPFDYLAPTSVEEATGLLAEHGNEAQVIAGGQSLVPLLALRLARPSVLIDVNKIAKLGEITSDAAGVRLGATARQARIAKDATVAERVPALAAATQFVGHYQTRNRGTIGGSIALADPAAEYPAVAVALGANIEASSKGGTRQIAAADFFDSPYVTTLNDDELVTAVSFPDWGDGTSMVVDELARRSGDFALVGLVMAIKSGGDGTIERAGISWVGMGSAPRPAAQAQAALVGQKFASLDIAGIAELSLAETEPWDDIHASSDYRRTAGARLAERALRNLTGLGEAASSGSAK